MPTTVTEILADRAYEQVMNSIKLSAAAPCHIKNHPYICSCKAAMAHMSPADHIRTKRVYYCMILEGMLLDKEHAWSYTGSKETHDIFTTAEGLTPKHYICHLLQEHPVISQFFAPLGQLKTAIEATLHHWTARNNLWREKYGDRDTTRQKWKEEAYPDAPAGRSRPISELPPGMKIGDTYFEAAPPPTPVQIARYATDDGEHWFRVALSIPHPRNTWGRRAYGVCVEKLMLCHPDCEIGMEIYEEYLEHAAARALPELEKRRAECRTVEEELEGLKGYTQEVEVENGTLHW